MSHKYKNVPQAMCDKINGINICQPILGRVYRVSKSGRIDAEAFDNTYCEMINGTTGQNKDLDDPGTYSTSVYLIPDRCEKFVKLLAKKHRDKYPAPAVIVGEIFAEDGIAQKTIERVIDYEDPYHVDWWIYQGNEVNVANRFIYFSEKNSSV